MLEECSTISCSSGMTDCLYRMRLYNKSEYAIRLGNYTVTWTLHPLANILRRIIMAARNERWGVYFQWDTGTRVPSVRRWILPPGRTFVDEQIQGFPGLDMAPRSNYTARINLPHKFCTLKEMHPSNNDRMTVVPWLTLWDCHIIDRPRNLRVHDSFQQMF